VLKGFYEIGEVETGNGVRGNAGLEGITVEGKLCVIYSKRDLGCNWSCPKEGCPCLKSEDAFRIMSNIVFYALKE
jgi:hypothetical protein